MAQQVAPHGCSNFTPMGKFLAEKLGSGQCPVMQRMPFARSQQDCQRQAQKVNWIEPEKTADDEYEIGLTGFAEEFKYDPTAKEDKKGNGIITAPEDSKTARQLRNGSVGDDMRENDPPRQNAAQPIKFRDVLRFRTSSSAGRRLERCGDG